MELGRKFLSQQTVHKVDDDLSVAEVSMEQRNQLAVVSLPDEEHGAGSCLVRVYTEIEPLLPLKKKPN